MKKTIILILGALILGIGGFYTLDAYLCNHLYYGRGPFLTCTGGQGKGIDIVGNMTHWGTVLWGLVSVILPIIFIVFMKKISLRNMMISLFAGAALYLTGYGIIKDSLFGQGLLILIFNVMVLFLLFYWLLATMTVLGNNIFKMIKWHIGNSIHDVFLKFVLGLILFCFVNVLLLQLHLFYGVIILIEFLALTYLLYKNKPYMKQVAETVESFVTELNGVFVQNKLTYVLYVAIIGLGLLYLYMGLNLAYIPYPTAWDANHAYIFIPRMRAYNNGIYWGDAGVAGAVPYLWYGFLTFWFKFTTVMPGDSGLFGISPDSITIIMNYWSGPLVLLSSGFTLHAILTYISGLKGEKVDPKTIIWCLLLGIMFVIVWLTSGMGAFLVFVDNKTDLSVLFFTVIALYSGVQFLRALKDNSFTQYTKHYAILSGLFFAASALAKPTGMFDIIHFAMLLFLQWNRILLAIGGYITILGGLGLSKLLLVNQFITTTQSYWLLGIGFITALIGFFPTIKKGFKAKYLRYFIIWLVTIIGILVIYKGPFALVQQYKKDGTINIPNTIRTILLGNHEKTPAQKVLLASNFSQETLAETGSTTLTGNSTGELVVQNTEQPKNLCVATPGQDLYANLKSAGNDGASEDLGRYIGYGQRVFRKIMLLSWIPNGCYSIYQDARGLCPNIATVKTGSMQDIVTLLQPYKDIPGTFANKWIDAIGEGSDEIANKKIRNEIATYIESNTLIVKKGSIGIPYKFLVPFNITFNWSLQNLSSYYTDIGIVWLLGLFMALLGILYGILNRNKILVSMSVITVGAWGIWWVVGSAILWYSLGVIIWTIVGMMVFVYTIIHNHDKKDELQKMGVYAIIGLLVFWGFVQLILNFLRISSQGAGGPFAWYKSNVGEKYVFNDQLMADRTVKIGFNADDVLDLQFPHYKGILSTLNNRNYEDGVVVAGTYLQYFINEQHNVQSDGFLSIFWENISDNNVCNSYLRLKDQNKKYLVIDPNIASVVMGDGNKSLFDRFYAVVGSDGKLQQHGTLTMLQALAQQGYLKLFSTNNIITKYAFILSDEQLSAGLNITDKEQLILERAKMSAARFFPNGDTYGNVTLQAFAYRMNTYEAISDISDVIGKPIREDVVVGVAKYVDAGLKPEQYTELQKKIQDLSQDEKTVLQQYFAFKKSQKENPQQFRQYIVSLVTQSINNGSQLIVLTVE